jgi:hypothetical protein
MSNNTKKTVTWAAGAPSGETPVLKVTLIGTFCNCRVFIPSYETSAVKCGNCGKPPRGTSSACSAVME